MYPSGRNGYQAIEVDSMSPARSIVFLYGHLLGQLNQAKHHLAERNHEARSRNLNKARDVVNELLVSLNRADGGEIAENLAALYAFFLKELIQIDLHQDAGRLDRLQALVSSLHEAWVEAEKSYEQQVQSQAISANA
jgi:flagellar protein FliS